MPERLPTARPTIMAGTNLTSGDPNTGQVMMTQGGAKYFSRMSGVVGPDVLVQAGGGRVDHVEIFPGVGALAASTGMASGIPLILYDSAVAVSGGPLNTSGHRVIAKIHPAAVGGTLNQCGPGIGLFNSGALIYGGIVQIGRVFTSGLVVATTSGMTGFVISYTPVVSGTNPNLPVGP